jgi:hypothetical protein
MGFKEKNVKHELLCQEEFRKPGSQVCTAGNESIYFCKDNKYTSMRYFEMFFRLNQNLIGLWALFKQIYYTFFIPARILILEISVLTKHMMKQFFHES